MTGCIVGWAHTPFGRLETETRRKPDRAGRDRCARGRRHRAARRGRDRARPFQRRLLGAGFHRLAGAAGLARPALQARDPGGECLRDRLGRRASGAARDRGGKAARIVLVVGVEQMTTTPGPEIGRNLLKASYVREEADIEGGFAGIFGKIAGAYFQHYGDQSDALARDRREEPQERRRQSLCANAQGSRLRFLPQ